MYDEWESVSKVGELEAKIAELTRSRMYQELVAEKDRVKIAELEATIESMDETLISISAQAIREAVNQIDGLDMHNDVPHVLAGLLRYADNLEGEE